MNRYIIISIVFLAIFFVSCQKLKVRSVKGEYFCEITQSNGQTYTNTIEVKGAGNDVEIFGCKLPMKELRKGEPLSCGQPMGGQVTARLPKKTDSLIVSYLSISPGGYFAKNYRCVVKAD